MLTPEDFLADYDSYIASVIGPEREAVQQALKPWKPDKETLQPQTSDFWAKYSTAPVAMPNPVQRIRTRIKRPESVLDKYHRLSDQFPDAPTPEGLRSMRDLLGARVVVFFQSQLTVIDAEIRSRRQFLVEPSLLPRSYMSDGVMHRIGLSPEDFDMKGTKPSGYSSLHYFLCRKGEDGSPGGPLFELQVRTMAEELWAEVEHQLGYKPDRNTAMSVRRQFRVLSEHLAAIDHHLDFLNDELTYYQGHVDPVDDDKLNPENLPRLLSALGFTCPQGGVAGMLDVLESRDIRQVRDFRLHASAETTERVIAEYKRQTGHGFQAFTLVAITSELAPRPTRKQVSDAVRRNIAYNDYTWTVLRDRYDPHGNPGS